MSVIWSKTEDDGDAFLPLERHLADAGAVAQRLWDLALTDRQRRWIANGLGVEIGPARQWVTFLAATHDIGKASPVFQRMVRPLAERLLDADLVAELDRGDRFRHDLLGGAILQRWLSGRGQSASVAAMLSATIAGHHGQLRSSRMLRTARTGSLDQAPAWNSVQDQILEAFCVEHGLDLDAVSPESSDSAVVVAVAGLISVADWMASDTRYFPVTDGERSASRELSSPAVNAASWAPKPAPGAVEFSELFAGPSGEARPPRATQRAVVDLLEGSDEPRLLIIEDRTGSGKTEAALWAVRHGLRNGARGFYIGMPTKATADQLHERTGRFVGRLWPDEQVRPRLLHSGVEPETDLARPSQVGAFDAFEAAGKHSERSEGDDADRDAIAEAWFAGKRRGLLAPYAVGTVDQALLATVRAKHFFVRLWGLQGKVVVFDEVHSFDAYTGLLITRAVEWFAALDCTVVLLSATLPVEQRRRLTSAYRRGRLGTPEGFEVTTADVQATYPRVTIASEKAVVVRAVADDRPSRTVGLRPQPIPNESDAFAVARLALGEVDGGGCAAVVCNTVASAQSRYRALKAQAPGHVEIVLLHARLRPLERGPVERRLMDELGPEATVGDGRPDAMIVVATQIIEQSLDLDFDVMFSDLAPIDLLIQRAGRVHRHKRASRPERHDRAVLIVLDSEGDESVRGFLTNSEYVYVPAILFRTRLALAGRHTLTEPDDLDELIESVYAPDPPPGCNGEEQQHVLQLDQEAKSQRAKLGSWAELASIGHFEADEPVWDSGEQTLNDPDGLGETAKTSASTRWSERPSLTVVVLREGELDTVRYRPPGESDVTDLLRRAVSVSSVALVKPVMDAWREAWTAKRPIDRFQPSAWRYNPRLRDVLLVELDADGQAATVFGGSPELAIDFSHSFLEGVRVGKDAHDV